MIAQKCLSLDMLSVDFSFAIQGGGIDGLFQFRMRGERGEVLLLSLLLLLESPF